MELKEFIRATLRELAEVIGESATELNKSNFKQKHDVASWRWR
jgi:uncharacterized protein with HEPN domain